MNPSSRNDDLESVGLGLCFRRNEERTAGGRALNAGGMECHRRSQTISALKLQKKVALNTKQVRILAFGIWWDRCIQRRITDMYWDTEINDLG